MKIKLVQLVHKQNLQLNGKLVQYPVNEYVDKIIKHAHILSFCEKNEIAGFIAYYKNDIDKNISFLSMLCIDDKWKGRGLGMYLLKCSIFDLLEVGFKKYQLEVHKSNHPAINLYTKAGFKILEQKDEYIKMEMQLSYDR